MLMFPNSPLLLQLLLTGPQFPSFCHFGTDTQILVHAQEQLYRVILPFAFLSTWVSLFENILMKYFLITMDKEIFILGFLHCFQGQGFFLYCFLSSNFVSTICFSFLATCFFFSVEGQVSSCRELDQCLATVQMHFPDSIDPWCFCFAGSSTEEELVLQRRWTVVWSR